MRLSFFALATGFAISLLTTATFAADRPSSGRPLDVVVTLPDIADVVRAIGGEHVQVTSLLTGNEDPHFADATPSLMAKVARADIVCSMGLELESGWLPKVLAKAANAKVQPGGPGFCELGSTVTVLDRATTAVNRSMGDIHASGNPHFNLSPRALAEGARAVVATLKLARPERAADFTARLALFEKRMKDLEETTRRRLLPAIDASKNGPVLIEYHKEFAYFFSLYGIRSFGSIEEKPGVSPSAARLAEVALAARTAGVKIALASRHAPIKHVLRFSELSGVPHAIVPTGIGAKAGEKPAPATLEDVQTAIADAIAKYQ